MARQHEPVFRPEVRLLHHGPFENVVFAARLCYDSFFRKDGAPRTEGENLKLVHHLRANGHLTCFEHARWNVIVPRDLWLAEGFASMEKGPTYRWRGLVPPGWHRSEMTDEVTLGLNAAHIRQMAVADPQEVHPSLAPFGRRIARRLVGEYPALFDDLPLEGAPWPDCEIVADRELAPNERRLFPHASFHVTLSRAAATQLARHRSTSQDWRSQRYCEEDAGRVVWPVEAPVREQGHPDWFDLEFWATQNRSVYASLRRDGWSKGAARYILPNMVTTEVCLTAHAGALRHFFNLRCAPEAQEEIRYVAIRMLDLMKVEMPGVFDGVAVSDRGLEPWLSA